MQRPMTLVSALVATALAAAAISCDGDTPVEPEGLTTPLFSAGPAMQSVTGQGTTWVESSQQWYLIALDARRMPDGQAEGNFHWLFRSRNPGGRVFVKVSCLTISGNEARMVGQASQAGNPANIGKWMGLWVADHGEGAGAPPDQIFQRWFGADESAALAFCAGPQAEDPSPRDLVAGNIQVR